jgi:hypothetical protein
MHVVCPPLGGRKSDPRGSTTAGRGKGPKALSGARTSRKEPQNPVNEHGPGGVGQRPEKSCKAADRRGAANTPYKREVTGSSPVPPINVCPANSRVVGPARMRRDAFTVARGPFGPFSLV